MWDFFRFPSCAVWIFSRPDTKKLQELLFILASVVFFAAYRRNPLPYRFPLRESVLLRMQGARFLGTASEILPGRGSGAACDPVEEKPPAKKSDAISNPSASPGAYAGNALSRYRRLMALVWSASFKKLLLATRKRVFVLLKCYLVFKFICSFEHPGTVEGT